MIKKRFISQKDKKDWEEFLKNPTDIFDKEHKDEKKVNLKTRYRFDLHGFSLDAANRKVEELLLFCRANHYTQLLLITGKGIHSGSDSDVYSSKDLSKLRYSVPEYINNTQNLKAIIKSINSADKEDGGDGALIINLKSL